MNFIHKKAIVEGDVKLGKNSNVLAFAVIRNHMKIIWKKQDER